jgi:hypothetical protein
MACICSCAAVALTRSGEFPAVKEAQRPTLGERDNIPGGDAGGGGVYGSAAVGACEHSGSVTCNPAAGEL